MAKVEIPPDFMAIMASKGDAVLAQLARHAAVDARGRYLHWHEFRWRVAGGIDKEVAWAATRLARACSQHRLDGLHSEQGNALVYAIPASLQIHLHAIDRLCAPLLETDDDAAAAGPERNRYLVDALTMEEAITSAQLEGAATTRKIAKAMLENERLPRDEGEQMVFNNFLLMKAAKRARNEPLSVERICRLHDIATRDTGNAHVQPGRLRDHDEVVVQGLHGDVLHRPPPASQLVSRLQQLCAFANTAHDGLDGRPFIHPAVKAIILHFMLGYEHPFTDGNGRTARALFYWFMLRQGYWPFEYISISALLKEAPVQYGESYLFCETDTFDLTYFIDFQLRIIHRAIRQFLAHLQRKQQEHAELLRWLDTQGIADTLNARQGLLLRKALRHPGRAFTVKEVKHDFGVTENTARADLQKLVSLQALVPAREGKTICYIAHVDARNLLRQT